MCLDDAVDDRQTETDACMVGADAFGAALKRLDKGGNQLGASFSPVFSTVSTTPSGRTLVVTRAVPWSDRLWTIALCTRFVVICSRSAGEPTVSVVSPEASRITPCCSARAEGFPWLPPR